MPATKSCEHCQTEFTPVRITARFCSTKCRVYASRAAEPKEAVEETKENGDATAEEEAFVAAVEEIAAQRKAWGEEAFDLMATRVCPNCNHAFNKPGKLYCSPSCAGVTRAHLLCDQIEQVSHKAKEFRRDFATALDATLDRQLDDVVFAISVCEVIPQSSVNLLSRTGRRSTARRLVLENMHHHQVREAILPLVTTYLTPADIDFAFRSPRDEPCD